jgi:oxygen-independent coproporphyrinogen-3 oxidase
VYIHWPFCKSKCPYCDFNSHVQEVIPYQTWANAYIKELQHFQGILKNKVVTSIFIGGGTPSLAEPFIFEAIFKALAKITTLAQDVEITLEANPSSIDAPKFKEFASIGINRISIGIQSLMDSSLKFLGRNHSASEALKAIETAAKYFKRYSFDLIYALPGHTINSWKAELKQALKLVSSHISLYQLTIEKGTQFHKDFQNKKFTMPSNELSAEFYEVTTNIMEQANLPSYEVSNYAQAGEECRHNMSYWRYQDYIGIGPGAHGRYTNNGQKIATTMIYSPNQWLKAVNEAGQGLQKSTSLSYQESLQEKIIMGLRLQEGIDKNLLLQNPKFSTLNNEGLLEINCKQVRTTRKGRLFLDYILLELALAT